MIVICERCASEYEVGDIEEGKILRCNKCGDTWKHLINKKHNIIDEAKFNDEFNEFLKNSDDEKKDKEDAFSNDIEDENPDNEEKKQSNFLMYVLFIIVIAMIYFLYEEEITTLVQNILARYFYVLENFTS